MTVDIVNQQNEKVGSLALSDEVFGGRVKADLIHASVVRANAAERRGTHATKTRAMVAGSGKKPWRRRAPAARAWARSATRCGARAARSTDRSRGATSISSKKVEKGALRAALSSKLQDGDVTVVDALAVENVKTKAAAEMLRRLGVTGGRKGKALFVDVAPQDELALSVRNIAGVRLLASNRITARDVADTRRVVLTQAALEKLQAALG